MVDCFKLVIQVICSNIAMLEARLLDLFWFEATTSGSRSGHQVQHVRSDGSPEQHVAGSGGLEVR